MIRAALVNVASLLIAVCTLNPSQHECVAIVVQNHPSKMTTRRAILSSTLAFSQALLVVLTPHHDALADTTTSLDLSPQRQQPLVPGSRVQYRPTGEGLQWSPSPPSLLQTRLAQTRIGAKELSPLNPKLSPFANQELYYPTFMFGSWNVTATLKRKVYPYGVEVLPSRSLLEGSPRNRRERVGNSVTYEQHYFSTLADTLSNQVTVNLGLGVPQSKIILDRAHSAKAISRAYQQLAPVQDVEWNPRTDPTRLTLLYGQLTDDMRPLGQCRTEIYVTARDSEFGNENCAFCACERNRIVMLSPGNVIVSDTEATTEYRLLDDNTILAISRIAVYLTPNPNSREGVLWQQVSGKAVAFYDYEYKMTRNLETFVDENGKEHKRACVKTPKDVIQCA